MNKIQFYRVYLPSLEKAPYNYVVGTYDYITNTPASQQWSDLKRDVLSLNTLDETLSMGLGIYWGAKSLGKMPKAQTPIRTMPVGAAPLRVNNFPTIRNGYGIFGQRGLIIKNYKIEAMYKHSGGSTIFSLTEGRVINNTFLKIKDGTGNIFRLDKHLHYIKDGLVNTDIPYNHQHLRWTQKNGLIFGKSSGTPIMFKWKYIRPVLKESFNKKK